MLLSFEHCLAVFVSCGKTDCMRVWGRLVEVDKMSFAVGDSESLLCFGALYLTPSTDLRREKNDQSS